MNNEFNLKENIMSHQHPSKKAVINRLSRIIGHAQSVKRMVEEDRDCTEILIQISAVKSALNNVGKVILQEHIDHCLLTDNNEKDQDAIEDLKTAIDKYIK